MTQSFSWPGGNRLALSLVMNFEEGAEYSIADGDKGPEAVDELGIGLRQPVRNYSNESNYRYGLKSGAPRVLDLFEKRGVQATFAAAAVALERAPDLARRIVAGGHEVCAHGHRWIQQHMMDEAEERQFIADATASITRTCGRRPDGWLSRYLVSANTRRLLVEAGYRYHMDDFSADAPFWVEEGGKPLLIVPYAPDTNDMKMWQTPGFTHRDWLDYNVDTFDVLYREGADAPRMMSVGLHLRIIGRPARFGALEKFLNHVAAHSNVWVTTRRRIAEFWIDKMSYNSTYG